MIEDDVEYIGDGVYVAFDGHSVHMAINDHRNPALVVLEPEVMKALFAYWMRMTNEPRQSH